MNEWGTLASILSQMIAVCDLDAITLGEKPKNKIFSMQAIYNYVQQISKTSLMYEFLSSYNSITLEQGYGQVISRA